VTPFDAKQLIVGGAGTNFHPKIVAAFEAGEMEIPEGLAV
jgi:hypothetical protein